VTGSGCGSGQAEGFRSEGQASMILYNTIVGLAAGVALVAELLKIGRE